MCGPVLPPSVQQHAAAAAAAPRYLLREEAAAADAQQREVQLTLPQGVVAEDEAGAASVDAPDGLGVGGVAEAVGEVVEGVSSSEAA